MLVKPQAEMRTPSSRCWSSPWLEASMRQMIDAVLLQLRQQFVDFHRIGRGVRQRHRALGPDHADRAQAGGGLAQRRPDFAQEGDDGGFALGAGDGGDRLGLGAEEGRGIARQAQRADFRRQ